MLQLLLVVMLDILYIPSHVPKNTTEHHGQQVELYQLQDML